MTFDQLLAALRAAAPGQESTLYLVGGCVRDGLVGRPLVDVDIAVEGDALACARAVAAHTSATYVPWGSNITPAAWSLPKAPFSTPISRKR